MNVSIYSKYNIDEIALVIKVVAAFLDNPPPFLEFAHLSIFFELAFTVLTEKSFPTKIRLMVHRIIESSVDMIVDNYRDRLNILIQISIELSLEVCDQQRDDNSYEFPISFFYTIVDAYDSEIEGIFELFLSFANGLIFSSAQNSEISPARRQVALLIITSIIEGTQEIVSERLNELIQFVLQIADYDDPYVFGSACNTLNELIEYVTEAISLYAEEITSYALQHIVKYTNDAIMLLNNLFLKCGTAPKDTNHIFNVLTSLINQPSIHFEQIEMIISCISSLLLQSNSPDAYISSFLTILNRIYQNKPHLRDVIFNFYGDAVTVAPLVVKNDLPNLVKMILLTLESVDHIQDGANFQFFQSAALCLKQIAQFLPVSLISMPIFQQSVPYLLKMISLKNQISDESLFMHAQSAAISCLLTFLGYMPNTMQKYLQTPLLEFLFQRHDALRSYIVSISDSLASSIQGFHILGIQLFDLIIIIITKILMFTEKKEVIISILTMLTEVVCTYKADILKRQDMLHTFVSSLYQILTVPPLGFLKTEHSNYIDQQIQFPLFQFISEFIFALYEFDLNISTTILTNVFVPSILPYIKSNSSLMKSHSIEILSLIVFCLTSNINVMKINNPSDEAKASLIQLSELVNHLIQITTEAGFEIIKKLQNIESRRFVAKAFMFLISVKRDIFADKLDILVPFSIELIEFCGFTGLWCIIAVCFSVTKNQTNLDDLKALINSDRSIWNRIQFAIQSHFLEEKEFDYNFDMLINIAVTTAVINEIPGGTDNISFDADFIYFMKNQICSISNNYSYNNGNDNETNIDIAKISSLLDEKLPIMAVTLFTANDKDFERATNQVKVALAQIIIGMKQETLTQLVNANEAKLVNLQRHLRMISQSSSGS